MKKIIAIIFLFFIAPTVYAGGYHFPIEIISFESPPNDEYSFKMIAIPVNKEKHWEEEKCEKIVVTGSYDQLKWLTYKRPMSKETQVQSIKLLCDAYEEKRPILFGTMGLGLHEVEKCSFLSKGLFVQDYKGQKAVYSVYERI